MDTLKPCPLCGDKAQLFKYPYCHPTHPMHTWMVRCERRCCISQEYPTPESAIRKWNARHEEPARLLTPEDWENNPNVDDYECLPCFVESKEGKGGWARWNLMDFDLYRNDLRPWNARPTQEQMEEMPWE